MTTLAAIDPKRIVVVTGGLVLAGAGAGGLCGLAASVGWIGMSRGVSALLDVPRGDFLMMSLFGAVIGALATPVLVWGVLRHVALGRVLLVAAPATILGAWLGDVVVPLTTARSWNQGAFIGAVLGFLGAAIWLRVAAERHRRKHPE